MTGAFRLLGKKRKLILMGHALSGVRVDGASPRRFLRFLSLTALRAEGCGLPLCGNAYKVSVMREGS